ncbi:WbqC family protein [Marmoricola endophyticus]|uniref:WbqC family protein n=1 Tax=Marmoricola endophyticus TaxID=2040280 RepID=UPI00166C7DC9|nr:WbqC family protein [Marmoricola endophyticus]
MAIHQPDLLPYSGFWFKMATSDVFVVAVHDQFQKHGYQRRVTMREAWCSHRLVGKPSLVPIDDVEVAEGWQQHLCDVIRGRYTGARHWRDRGGELLERISACTGTTLDEVNLSMIRAVRDLLGIGTELVVTAPPRQAGIDRLIEQVATVGGTEYVSGAGGAAYLGADADERFADHGITLRWSAHVPASPDSIVTVLMDHDDPMDVVRRTA